MAFYYKIMSNGSVAASSNSNLL